MSYHRHHAHRPNVGYAVAPLPPGTGYGVPPPNRTQFGGQVPYQAQAPYGAPPPVALVPPVRGPGSVPPPGADPQLWNWFVTVDDDQ